ncbi:nucleotide phosphatase [Lithospermum erythrorhizon]|uniref:Nucleotide phosphatase n=1 Tax=Lithospermum erythrorhizon TaxID=34254 RepID=A0AAV3NLE4_LITER
MFSTSILEPFFKEELEDVKNNGVSNGQVPIIFLKRLLANGCGALDDIPNRLQKLLLLQHRDFQPRALLMLHMHKDCPLYQFISSFDTSRANNILRPTSSMQDFSAYLQLDPVEDRKFGVKLFQGQKFNWNSKTKKKMDACNSHSTLFSFGCCPCNQNKSHSESGRAYNRMETEPGFDKLVHNMSGLRGAIKPLIKWAKKQIPEKAHKSTSLFLYATAGLRRLPSTDSEWVLNNAWSILKSSPFLCKREWIKIISGMEEAYFGWIALDYHSGTLGTIPNSKTFGALDMGGSSLQKLPQITNANLSSGKVEVKHPCLQSGYNEQYMCSQCASALQEGGIPSSKGKKLGKGGKPGEFCEKSWDVAKKSVAPQPSIEQYCFRAPYVVFLLREGLHITDSNVAIGSGSITWTLGVALVEAGKTVPTRMYFGRPYLPLFRHNNPSTTSVLTIPAPFCFHPIIPGDGRVKLPLSPTDANTRPNTFDHIGIQLTKSPLYRASSVSPSLSSDSLGNIQSDNTSIGSPWPPHRSKMRLQSRKSQSREDLYSGFIKFYMTVDG